MQKIHDLTYVVFDLEATYHPNVGFHEIIEIGAHKLESQNLDIEASFERLVKPSSPINYQIRKKTGITDSLVQNAKRIADVWIEFSSFVENAILVGHQSSLDISVLRKTAEYHKLPMLTNPVLDTLRFAKHIYPNEISYSLEHFQIKLGVSVQKHRAQSDAYVTAILFKHIVQILENEFGLSEYEQLQDFCYSENPRQMRLF
jgi:DNA polymerase III subunit alpha, Gram-positive type